MPSIYLSAAHKSSGKTVVSLGLCAAFQARSLSVQSFKKGPDYIDPIWLSEASSRACYNLDFYTMSNNEIVQLYQNKKTNAEVSLIEGNKGLFDGLSSTGGDANADLAKLLNTPVVLTIDVTGITRGIAPLLQGYVNFDASVNIAGVILNKVAGKRHESKLIQAIEHYTDLPILGSIYRDKRLVINERHLGLIPANETPKSRKFINQAAELIAQQVDLDRLLKLTRQKDSKTVTLKTKKTTQIINKLTLAVAKDCAFGFYYADDLEAFKALGVNILFFDCLQDAKLPACDGLFIGGGFPERHLEALSCNQSMLADIKSKIKQGLPAYAECGGLMYLSKSIDDYPMVGVIDAQAVMKKKPMGRGYVKLCTNKVHPWCQNQKTLYAHEFHYSKLEKIKNHTRYGFEVLRGVGVNNNYDGIVQYNLFASYAHLRNTLGSPWVQGFVNFIKKIKNKKQ
jgi:cobyrinic acid a,c-diamide synthase